MSTATRERLVVLVTGASSGFGRAIALRLAQDGHEVIGTSRRGEAAAVAGFRMEALDVTDEDSVSRCVGSVLAAHGRIDVLINNAGMGIAGALEDTSTEEMLEQIDANFLGQHRLCRAVLPGMRARSRGVIINMSSLAGLTAVPFQGAYSVSKFATEAYSEALRMEVKPFGIRVAMIEPGDYTTGFTGARRMTRASTAESAYHRRCEAAIARMARDEMGNPDLAPVVDAVSRILRARRPALRYPRAMFVQRLFNALLPIMPDALVEFLIEDTYGLR